ncbi:putative ribonuclease H-like domain-containing protein [Tanacetum coccineum]
MLSLSAHVNNNTKSKVPFSLIQLTNSAFQPITRLSKVLYLDWILEIANNGSLCGTVTLRQFKTLPIISLYRCQYQNYGYAFVDDLNCFVLGIEYDITPSDTYSSRPPSCGVTELCNQSQVIREPGSYTRVPIPVTQSETGASTTLKMTVPSTSEEKNVKKEYASKLVSRLAILGVVTSLEDLNVKFLRSLPAEWDTHVVVWMNKPDFDTIGLDDLYNNFKIVEQKVKKSAGASNDNKNLAFLTTSGASSTNNINTVKLDFSTSDNKGSQLVHEDLEQLHDDDLEEMDLKWNMALLSMRARKFYQRTGRKIIINRSNTAGYDKSKIECFNCHKMGHFARECRSQEQTWLSWDSQILRPTPLDLSYSGLEEFKQPEVSDDEDEVEPKFEKKTIIPTATKKESVKPEKPVRRLVRHVLSVEVLITFNIAVPNIWLQEQS